MSVMLEQKSRLKEVHDLAVSGWMGEEIATAVAVAARRVTAQTTSKRRLDVLTVATHQLLETGDKQSAAVLWAYVLKVA